MSTAVGTVPSMDVARPGQAAGGAGLRRRGLDDARWQVVVRNAQAASPSQVVTRPDRTPRHPRLPQPPAPSTRRSAS